MSQEREVIEVKTPELEPGKIEVFDEEAAARAALGSLSVAERKARFVSILDRGLINDRLHVDLPDDIHGEWVRADPLDVDRLKMLGFWLDNKYSTKRAIHSDGSSANKVADVIFMCTTKENKLLIDEVRREQSERNLNPKRGQDKEESEFVSNVRAATGGDIPAFTESGTRKLELKEVLQEIDKQTIPQR